MRRRGWRVGTLGVCLLCANAWGGTNQDCVNNGQTGSPFTAGSGSVSVACQEGPFDPPGVGCGGAPGQVSGAGATLFVDFFRSPSGRCSTGPKWNREPAEVGYGLDPMDSSSGYISNLQSLTRQCGICNPGGEACTTNEPASLYCATGGAVCDPVGGPVSLNTNPGADTDTIRDFIGAWVPVLYVANRGTGLENVKYSEMQHLFVTGRMPNGENLVAGTRSVGSGTRNAHMNSSGIDTSWGRGDNVGNEENVTSKFNLGPGTQRTNGGGSSQTEQGVEMSRLAVAYTGMAGPSRAVEDATGGRYELLNLCKDVDTDGNPLCDCQAKTCPEGPKHCSVNTSIACVSNAECSPTSANGTCVADDVANPNNGYVRPSVNAVLDNHDPCCGYQIGGNGSFVVRGERNANRQLSDPEYQVGVPLDNQAVADYLNNIADSIRDYVLAGNFEAGSCNFSEVCSSKRCSVSGAVCTGTGQGNCAAGNVCQFIACDTVVGPACPGGFGSCIANNTCLVNADCADKGCSVTHVDCNVAGDCIDETCDLGTNTCTQTGGPCTVNTDCPARGQTCDNDFCRGSSNMPAQYLATNFFLPQGIDAQQSLTDGMVFVAGGVNQALQNYIRANSVISVPAYGSVNPAGRVPVRNGLSAPNKYSDGSTTGSYTYWDGISAYITNFSSGQRLACRNRIQGDFNKDCVRDINDASELVKAHYGPRAWQQTAVANGNPPCPASPVCNNGNQTSNNAIPEVIGDFDGDGNLTKEDLRYFADGLAMSGGQLNRKLGAIAIDEAIVAAGQALPWNDPSGNLTVPPASQPNEPTFTPPIAVNACGDPFLATGKPYAPGDFRGDVAGGNPTAGAQPLGWDSSIDDQDIDYCCYHAQIGDWSNINDAVYMDLSCDMDGDLDVDAADVAELVEDILGTYFGDVDLDGDRDADDEAIVQASIDGPNPCIAGATCGWADGDTNCDGTVNASDLDVFATFEARGFLSECDHPVMTADPIRTRALSIEMTPSSTAAGTSTQSAIRVQMIDLQNPNPPNNACCPPPDFSAYEAGTCTAVGESAGCARWVGQPRTYLEAQELPGFGNYRAARLQCSPFYYDWGSEGVVHIIGAEIVPSSMYEIQAYPASCKGAEENCAFVFPSPPLQVATQRAGDITAPYAPGAVGQPNAIDVVGAVNTFKKAIGAPKHIEAQVQPNLPNLNRDVDALDIQAIVANVKLGAYPYSGPCPCPSTVVCNATMCSGAMPCPDGNVCMQTCSAGPRVGELCTANKHCGVCVGGPRPGIPCDANSQCDPFTGGACLMGTCNTQGFCRDRCGRCD